MVKWFECSTPKTVSLFSRWIYSLLASYAFLSCKIANVDGSIGHSPTSVKDKKETSTCYKLNSLDQNKIGATNRQNWWWTKSKINKFHEGTNLVNLRILKVGKGDRKETNTSIWNLKNVGILSWPRPKSFFKNIFWVVMLLMQNIQIFLEYKSPNKICRSL